MSLSTYNEIWNTFNAKRIIYTITISVENMVKLAFWYVYNESNIIT